MDIFPRPLLRITQPVPVTKTVFQEAYEFLAEWEKSDPRATHIAMVLDGQQEIVIAVAGPEIKESAAAGLFFKAATMVAS